VLRLTAHRITAAGVKQPSEGFVSRQELLWDQISWSPGMGTAGSLAGDTAAWLPSFPKKEKSSPNQTYRAKSKIITIRVLNSKL